MPEKDYQKEVALPIGNASQNPQEDVTNEVELPSSTEPLVEEEVLEEAKEENGALEEAQKEQIHQIEVNERELNTNSTYQFEKQLVLYQTGFVLNHLVSPMTNHLKLFIVFLKYLNVYFTLCRLPKRLWPKRRNAQMKQRIKT